MSEKTSGYILLIIGIITMIFATSQIILVFTGRAKPIKLFNYETESSESAGSFNPQDLLKQFQNQTEQSSIPSAMPNVQLIDPKALNDILNLTVYYLIMQFLLSLGFKFASLGIQLLRPIIVQMKNRTLDHVKDNTHIN